VKAIKCFSHVYINHLIPCVKDATNVMQ